MQSNKISFKGQNIFVGIDVHLKTWHVTSVTESGCRFSFAQQSDATELFDRLNKKYPGGHFKSAYESGFCGFSVHYVLVEQGIENIVVHAADIPTTGKERVRHATLSNGWVKRLSCFQRENAPFCSCAIRLSTSEKRF